MNINEAIIEANEIANEKGYGVLVVKNVGDASGHITMGSGNPTQWQNYQLDQAVNWMLESWDGVVVASSYWDDEAQQFEAHTEIYE